jgi:hypothetical protein
LIDKVKHNAVSHNIIYADDESTKDDDVYDMSAHRTKRANKCGKRYVRMQHANWFSLDDNKEFGINLTIKPILSFLDMKTMDMVLPLDPPVQVLRMVHSSRRQIYMI